MSIEKESYLYEALIRFDANGYRGSHQVWVDKYIDTDTGEVISEKERAAEPLAELSIVELVGGQSIVMAAQITELEAANLELTNRVNALEATDTEE